MADEDDALTVGLQAVDDFEETVDLGGGEDRRRFVEDDEAGLAFEHLDDLHPLLDAHREIFNHGIGVDLEVVAAGDLAYGRARLAFVEPAHPLRRLIAKDDVLGNREDRNEHEMLVHHADAGRDGIPGRMQLQPLAVDEHFTRRRCVKPIEDVHESGLAGSVLTEQGNDLAFSNVEVDVVVGEHTRKLLCNALQLEFQQPLRIASVDRTLEPRGAIGLQM